MEYLIKLGPYMGMVTPPIGTKNAKNKIREYWGEFQTTKPESQDQFFIFLENKGYFIRPHITIYLDLPV